MQSALNFLQPKYYLISIFFQQNESVSLRLNKGIKRQFSVAIEEDHDLRVVISTTGDVSMYLRIGKDVDVNSALYDADIFVEKVWKNVNSFVFDFCLYEVLQK